MTWGEEDNEYSVVGVLFVDVAAWRKGGAFVILNPGGRTKGRCTHWAGQEGWSGVGGVKINVKTHRIECGCFVWPRELS